LRRYVRGGQITNQTTTALYRNAKIGLNLYRSSMGWGKDAERLPAGYAESCNPRAYELAATGCFAVSEYRPEVPEVFGDLVPTFRTPDELAAQVARWLADDAGRARVREALPAQVRPQSWDARVDQMLANMRAADAARMATAWVMPAAPSVTTRTAGQVPA
jgi:glycosyltransferase involved in cell wall biosynthesis